MENNNNNNFMQSFGIVEQMTETKRWAWEREGFLFYFG